MTTARLTADQSSAVISGLPKLSPRLVSQPERHGPAARPPAERIAACLDEWRAFAGAGPRLDDLTLLAIRRRG